MLSRVADSLYWLSRYLERAEHTARLIDVDVQLRLDQSPDAATARRERLLASLQIPSALAGVVDARTILRTLTFDRETPSSIVSCVASGRENLLQVREQASSEMWEQFNRLYLQVIGSNSDDSWILQSNTFFRAVQEGSFLFQGVTDATMSHGEGWHYLQLGRFLERTELVALLVGTHFSGLHQPSDQPVEGADYLEWVGLLKCCSAFEAYCKVYSAEIRPVRIAEFLLFNPEFPHSISFSVGKVHGALHVIGELTGRKADLPLRIAGRLQATLRFTQIEEILAEGVRPYLDGLRHQCTQAHSAIQQIYFDYPVETAMAAGD